MSSGSGDGACARGSGVLGIATTAVQLASTPFQRVMWCCRAPLRSGRLCPRRDRSVCPLHGPVLPRTPTGQPDVVYANKTLLTAECDLDAALGLDSDRLAGCAEGEEEEGLQWGVRGRSLDSDDSEQEDSPEDGSDITRGASCTTERRPSTNGSLGETGSNLPTSASTKESSGISNYADVHNGGENCEAVGEVNCNNCEVDGPREAGGFIIESDDDEQPCSRPGAGKLLLADTEVKNGNERRYPVTAANASTDCDDVCSPSTSSTVQQRLGTVSDQTIRIHNGISTGKKESPSGDVSGVSLASPVGHESSVPCSGSTTTNEVDPSVMDSEETIALMKSRVISASRLVESVRIALAREKRTACVGASNWQNPVLLAQIKAATGVDLDLRNIRKGRRRPGAGDSGGLTSLTRTGPRQRLAKKVLSKMAVSRLNKLLAKKM